MLEPLLHLSSDKSFFTNHQPLVPLGRNCCYITFMFWASLLPNNCLALRTNTTRRCASSDASNRFRILFMGRDEFSCRVLEQLHKSDGTFSLSAANNANLCSPSALQTSGRNWLLPRSQIFMSDAEGLCYRCVRPCLAFHWDFDEADESLSPAQAFG